MWIKDSKLKDFQHYIQNENLSPEREYILVAVSGGVDSMVLAHLFRSFGFKLALAHVNYKKRGAESDGDEELVKSTALEWKIPFHSIQYEEPASSGNFQEKARNFRYKWFASLIEKHRYTYLALAHHADDQLETFFMNLIRASGLDGLSSMQKREGNKLRPLLGVFKSEIYQYAKVNGLSFREDHTNFQNLYLRNQVRNQVIPELSKIGKEAKLNALLSINHLQASNNLLQYMLSNSVYMFKDGMTYIINKDPLFKAPDPKTLLFLLLKPYHFNAAQCTDILRAEAGSRFISDDYLLIGEKDYFRLFEKEQLPDPFHIQIDDFGTVHLPHGILSIEPHSKERCSKSEEVVTLNFPDTVFPLTIDNDFTGKTFAPSGMKGKRKTIKKFLSDNHLDYWQRRRTFLITKKEEVVCVYPHRVAEKCCQPGSGTKVDFIFKAYALNDEH